MLVRLHVTNMESSLRGADEILDVKRQKNSRIGFNSMPMLELASEPNPPLSYA